MTLSSPTPSTFRLWLDLARAGNFPSVWSNVLAAFVLSATTIPAGASPGLFMLTLLAGTLAYAGGTTLNDVFDAEFDRRHRPERAIPQGQISRRTAGWVGATQLALGVILLIGLGASVLAAVGLAATILIYNWLHKRWTGSVIVMAGCRVMLAVSIATLPGHAMTLAFVGWVGGLFVYIVVLSLLARREYQAGASSEALTKLVRQMLAFIPFVDTLALIAFAAWLPALCSALTVPIGKWAQRMAASS